ncbi:AraC family transcriptional regulator [Streptosporangium sp. NPDC048865]|uniref:AraC family transcriptional regulator n=1 Tax=Streptosporangium sp. NPDC048865 TaxID=3155766 RepID=UPI0034231BEC
MRRLTRDERLDALCDLLARHAGPGGVTRIEDVHLVRAKRGGALQVPADGTAMTLIARGEACLAQGEHVHRCLSGQYFVSDGDVPIMGNFADGAEPALFFSLMLRPTAVADVLLRAEPDRIAGRDEPAAGLTVEAASDGLLDAMIRLLRLLDEPCEIKVLAPLIVDEILWRLVSGENGAAVRQLALADGSFSRVARAVRWIRDNYTLPFRVSDLAELSGLSVSSFQREFQLVKGMSPIQFQKQLRLRNARLLLATRASNVTEVGRSVGYVSSTQFIREYRRLFGAPPKQDAARLREMSSG